jgi:rSAM/selenodomain-associated transferase 1
MAKRPVAGAVKTRLCPPLSPEQAAELALAMLDDTVEKCLACPEFETSLCAAPAEDLAWFRERYPHVHEVAAQAGADLGQRLARHFERAAAAHPGWTLACLGADAPQVRAERIVEAHRELEVGADLVLGPDRGGGYYLVALVRPRAELFTSVEMSASDMCASTIARAHALGLSVHLLEPDFDVDGPEDLALLARESAPARTASVLARLLSRQP